MDLTCPDQKGCFLKGTCNGVACAKSCSLDDLLRDKQKWDKYVARSLEPHAPRAMRDAVNRASKWPVWWCVGYSVR
jgi:hypothetical protein